FRSHMKTITRSTIYLPMAIILTAALALPAAAQQVPFKGTFLGSDTVSGEGPCPTTVCTRGTGTGILLGQFSFTQEITINFANLYPTETGSAEWTAANGDKIYTTVIGFAIPGDVVFLVTEVYTITGGTGRFSGAKGIFTMHRTHVLAFSD